MGSYLQTVPRTAWSKNHLCCYQNHAKEQEDDNSRSKINKSNGRPSAEPTLHFKSLWTCVKPFVQQQNAAQLLKPSPAEQNVLKLRFEVAEEAMIQVLFGY